MYDLDDSGSICRNELKLIMQSLGFTITDGNVLTFKDLDLTKVSEICEAWMQEYDEDGNEVIDFLEFYRVRNSLKPQGYIEVQSVQSII